MYEALLIIMCFVAGVLSRGLYNSIRERKGEKMKELSEEERFNEFLRVFTRKEAYRRIKEMLKPKATRKFVEKWAYALHRSIDDMPEAVETIFLQLEHFELWGIKLLKEAGVEVKDD